MNEVVDTPAGAEHHSAGLIHPDLRHDGADGAARSPSGARLDHAEGTSQPLRIAAEPEPKDAIARSSGDRRIDQASAAARFIAAHEHAKMHDERLWDLRRKRDREMQAIPEWEELRELASKIKQHTLSRLDHYLEEFERNAKANGIGVLWAHDAEGFNTTVHAILKSHGATRLIKSPRVETFRQFKHDRPSRIS